jgi:acetyl-CoA C-acetyltransferase
MNGHDPRAGVIVGIGHTRFGRLDGQDLESLIVAAASEAIEDAGIGADEIDGMWLGHFNSGLVPDGFCSSMMISAHPALRFKPATRCENACASGAAALYAALDAIEAGRARIALVVGAEKMTGRDTAGVTDALAGASYQAEETGMSFPMIFARYASAYAERFGDPAEAMAHIAVKNHANALRNPLAHMHRAIDLDFCRTVSERNPLIADPLKLSDCSLITDGAAALIVAHRDELPRFRRGVGFRSTIQVNDVLPLSGKDPALFEGPRQAFARAYAAAGVTVDDIDLAEVHDCFTIAELQSVEAMGLASLGAGRSIVIEGQTQRHGRLPINLSGGLKAKGHPVGATGVSMHALVARQLLGEAGEMQLDGGAELGLCFNMGGGAVASCVSILEPVASGR